MPKQVGRGDAPLQGDILQQQAQQRSHGGKRITKIAFATVLAFSVAAVASIVALYFANPALLAPAGGLYLCAIPGTTGTIALFILIEIPIVKRTGQVLNRRTQLTEYDRHQELFEDSDDEALIWNDKMDPSKNEIERIAPTHQRPHKRRKKNQRVKGVRPPIVVTAVHNSTLLVNQTHD